MKKTVTAPAAAEDTTATTATTAPAAPAAAPAPAKGKGKGKGKDTTPAAAPAPAPAPAEDTAAAAPAEDTAAAAPTAKEMRERGMVIGSAATGEEKYSAAADRYGLTPSPAVRLLMEAYMGANSRPMQYARLENITAAHGKESDRYRDCATALWLAALTFSDAPRSSRTADRSPEGDALFSKWREYLNIFTEEYPATDTTPAHTVSVPARFADLEILAKMTTGTVTEVLTAARHTTAAGKVTARTIRGIKSDSAASHAAFIKSVERFTAERILDVDGVVSIARKREIAKQNKAKRAAAVAEVILEPAAPAPAPAPAAAPAAEDTTPAA